MFCYICRCLIAITEKYFTSHYFDQNLIGAQSDQEVMKDLLREKLPKLATHLESMEIELCTITLNWFLAIFFDSIPFEVSIPFIYSRNDIQRKHRLQ